MKGRLHRKQLLPWLAVTVASLHVAADEALIAVAANFHRPMREIGADFERQSGHQLQLSVASSGKLYAQILQGAPFDVLLSADRATPAALVAAGYAVDASRFTYARGRLVLWSAVAGDARERLLQGRFRKLAIANPRLAPYGAAAEETLTRLDVLPAIRSRLVMGENIAQTYQFVATGNATLGLLAASQVLTQGEVPPGAWLVPDRLHRPIDQDAVLLGHGRDNSAAMSLLRFLRSPAAAAVMRRHGYVAAGK